jgi:hypothetical protein
LILSIPFQGLFISISGYKIRFLRRGERFSAYAHSWLGRIVGIVAGQHGCPLPEKFNKLELGFLE